MTKQQKEVAQLNRSIRKLERENRMLHTELRGTKETARYWQQQYSRLLGDMGQKFPHSYDKKPNV